MAGKKTELRRPNVEPACSFHFVNNIVRAIKSKNTRRAGRKVKGTREMRNSHKIFVGNFEGIRDHLGDVVIVFFG